MPPMVPMIQLLGSACGQDGSTWNFGGSARAGVSSAAATKPIKAILRPMRAISSSHLAHAIVVVEVVIDGRPMPGSEANVIRRMFATSPVRDHACRQKRFVRINDWLARWV